MKPPTRGGTWEEAEPAETFDVRRFNAIRGHQAAQGREISRCLKELRLLRREPLAAEEPAAPDEEWENEPEPPAVEAVVAANSDVSTRHADPRDVLENEPELPRPHTIRANGRSRRLGEPARTESHERFGPSCTNKREPSASRSAALGLAFRRRRPHEGSARATKGGFDEHHAPAPPRAPRRYSRRFHFLAGGAVDAPTSWTPTDREMFRSPVAPAPPLPARAPRRLPGPAAAR